MIAAPALDELATRLEDRIAFDEPLSRHTSLRVGGPADALATPKDRAELADLLGLCVKHQLPTTFLGAGFNTLIRDGGLRGVVIRLKKLRDVRRTGENGIWVESGASHSTVTRFCVFEGLSGLEFGAGIPGSVGGWIAMNAGIGVRELKDVVREIELLGPDGTALPPFGRADLDFRYRELHGLPGGAVIVAATLEVEPSSPEAVKAEVDRLLAKRSKTQPLDVPSCGSVFRNPEGDFAGRLIEAAGLKGTREGAAEVSPVHANFIANRGGATAADVIRLIDRIRAVVESESGVRLRREVRIIGDDVRGSLAGDAVAASNGGKLQ